MSYSFKKKYICNIRNDEEEEQPSSDFNPDSHSLNSEVPELIPLSPEGTYYDQEPEMEFQDLSYGAASLNSGYPYEATSSSSTSCTTNIRPEEGGLDAPYDYQPHMSSVRHGYELGVGHMAERTSNYDRYPMAQNQISEPTAGAFGGSVDPINPIDHEEESQNKKTRSQKCSLCINHGIIRDKKGHKKDCSFKDCECDRCVITKNRQETMRNQQKLTRYLKKMQLENVREESYHQID